MPNRVLRIPFDQLLLCHYDPVTTHLARPGLVLGIAAALLLAGCAPTAPSDGGGTDSEAPPATDSDSGGTGADCSIFAGQTDPELMLFTSSALTAGPAEGQVFGDGTPLSVTL
jgi:hypothetical protein